MTKKLLAVLISLALVVPCFAGSVFAAEGDVTRLYVQMDDPNVNALTGGPGNLVRFRVVGLTEDNELATKIGGADFTGAIISVASGSWNDDIVLFESSYDEAINTAGAGVDEVAAAKGWAEFAVYYPADVNAAGTDVLTITLEKGATKITATEEVTVGVPVANAYFVAVDGNLRLEGATMPSVLGKLTFSTNDNGFLRLAGETVPVDVFAAYYDGADYYYTNTVPAGAENITIAFGGYDSAALVLTNGHVATDFTVEDLKITSKKSWAEIAAAVDSTSAEATITVATGKKSKTFDDVDGAGRVVIAADRNDILPANNDAKVTFVPAALQKVRIFGVPANQVGKFTDPGDALLFSGFGNQVVDAGDFVDDIVPEDVWYLANVSTAGTQAATFNIPEGAEAAIGVVVGFDRFDNPAPIATTIVLSKDTVADPAIGSPEANRAIFPFWVDLSAEDDVVVALRQADNPAIPGQLLLPEPLITFAKAAAIDAVTVTAWAAHNAPQPLSALADNDVTLSFIDLGKNKMKLGARDAAAGSLVDTVTLQKDGTVNNYALFTTLDAGTTLLGLVEAGGVKAVVPVDVVAKIGPVDRLLYPPQSVSAGVPNGQTAILDASYEAVIFEEQFSITDAIGNAGGKDLDFWRAEVGVFLANEDGSASTTPFPGAQARIIDVSDVRIIFSLANITPAQSAAVVKVTAGAASAETLINLRKVAQVAGLVRFVPLPVVDPRAAYIEVDLKDQAGVRVGPVAKGEVEVDVEVDIPEDGTVGGGAEADFSAGKLTLSTASYAERGNFLIVSPAQALLDVESDADRYLDVSLSTVKYGEATVRVTFVPDFEQPVIGALTAVNCGFTIAISDNVAVDGAATKVALTDNLGAAVSDFTITAADSGTGSLVTVGGLQAGSYQAEIIAKDKAGNRTAKATRIVTVTSCTELEPRCVEVNPAFAGFGETLDVTITVENMTFVEDATDVTFSKAGITVNSITVVSPAEVEVNITIAAEGTATVGVSNVTVTSGDVTVTCANAFEIIGETPPPPPDCELTIRPASVRSAMFFPQIRVLNIQGEGVAATDTVAFATDDIVPIIVLPGLPGRINVLVLVKARATSGTFEVTVGDCVGSITIR